MEIFNLIDDFNILMTTLRAHERQLCSEMKYLLMEELDISKPIIKRFGIRGLVVTKVHIDPFEVIKKLKDIIHEYPYKVRYAQRIIPIQKVIPTDVNKIKQAVVELAKSIPPENSFRVTLEKRSTSLHSKELIEAAASEINNKVNLTKPDNILLIEVLGKLTGVSVIKPDDILVVIKEKML
jgi:tRNA acetyltransferase TAN1